MDLKEFIAATPDDYVRIAERLAREPDRLRELRLSLRERVRHSAIAQVVRYTANLEAVFERIWRTR